MENKIKKVIHKASGKITEVGVNGIMSIESTGALFLAYVRIKEQWFMKNNGTKIYPHAYKLFPEDKEYRDVITIDPEYSVVKYY